LFAGLDGTLNDPVISDHAYRLVNRLLPREVYGISGADASHADAVLLQSFLTDLQKREKQKTLVQDIETLVAAEVQRLRPELAEKAPAEALLTAGIWLDVPKLPKIEDVEELVTGVGGSKPVPLAQVFPVGEWTHAYTHFKYQVRVFAFSEYRDTAALAARKALEQITRITGTSFYDGIERQRS